jgi:DNA-binding GntR family transcriptional regulator
VRPLRKATILKNRFQIVVHNVSDLVYSAVRDRILTGDIAPEAPVRQDALAAELGVSKIPLREALTRLEQDGLVSSMPNRGYIVRPMSASEAEEVFDLRLRLEPSTTATGASGATPQQRQAAIAALEALEAEQSAAGPRVAVLNREFHLALMRPSARYVTIQLLERLHLLAERYVRAHLEPQGRDRRARAEHAAMLKSWLSGDTTSVRKLVESHINGTLADLRLELRSKADSLLTPESRTEPARSRKTHRRRS